jgi:glycosyltransferase involved in cell wall biosynthesis
MPDLPPRRVLVLWTRISPYMCENWRKLAAFSDVELKIVAMSTQLDRDFTTFGKDVVRDLDIELVPREAPGLEELVISRMETFRPHAIFVAGWGVQAYRKALLSLRQPRPMVVMGMDTPWLGRIKQYGARWLLRAYLKKVDLVLAAEQRSVDYAKRLGFSAEQISTRLYSWDESLALRCQGIPKGEKRSFLFVGRYVPEKGLDLLVDAYGQYRDAVDEPWDLKCCGAGPLKRLLENAPGIQDLGFAQPEELSKRLMEATVFVLPSRFEPWGVAIAEAMGCGLPVIVSDQCGAGLDLVEHGKSGFIVPGGSLNALRDQLIECHRQSEQLAAISQRASEKAATCTSRQWAEHFRDLVTRSCSPSDSSNAGTRSRIHNIRCQL